MPEALQDYWQRNNLDQAARDFCQEIVTAAHGGQEFRDAAAFVKAVGMVDGYGGQLRDKIFARTMELRAGNVNAPKPLDEARSLAEALGMLNPD